MNIKFLFCIAFPLFILNNNPVLAQDNTQLIVMVKYKAQPGKESQALSSLKELVYMVKKEPHYVNILIHVDPADKTNILLYEEWNSEEYYKGEHMKTSHLQSFMKESRTFLLGPPDISFWKIHK